MASSYMGLYVQRLSDGTIRSVQVRNPYGHSFAMDPDLYLARDVQPPMEQLPDVEDYLIGALPDKP